MQRANYRTVDKDGFATVLAVGAHLAKSIEPKLLHMLYLRVSQINGCSYCVDLHFKDAIKEGVEPRVLNGVGNWKHMPFFTPREKAMLRWAEAVTHLPNQDVADEEYAALKEQFSDEEVVALTIAVGHMNSLNRIAMAFGKHPEK